MAKISLFLTTLLAGLCFLAWSEQKQAQKNNVIQNTSAQKILFSSTK